MRLARELKQLNPSPVLLNKIQSLPADLEPALLVRYLVFLNAGLQ